MKKFLSDILFYFTGSALVGISISCFSAPNFIAPGGFSGIATLLNYLFNLPIGSVILIMNIPVFCIGAKVFGKKFLYKSLIATVFMSAVIDVAEIILPKYTGDRILAAILGGTLSGFGLVLVFLRGATTGGIDIIAKTINLKYSHISIGRIILLLDIVIASASAVVYGNIESALYAAVLIFVQSRAIDGVLYGTSRCKVLLVSSVKYHMITEEIMQKLGRGVTVIDAAGAYSKKDMPLIFCAFRPYEAASVMAIIKNVDKSAFVVMLDASDVLGEGFNPLKGEDENAKDKRNATKRIF